ncbi:MAG: AraC family transcriptional regulator [Oscillospiraceae bacterium]|jgi:AraC-like DNA-binding protein|nr:AraC family transcriptional regulator [Oscillospiraceae bacterium]
MFDLHSKPENPETHIEPGKRFNVLNYKSIPTGVIDWHWHEDIEILFVKTGNITVYMEDTIYTLSDGDALIMPPGVCHKTIINYPPPDYLMSVICFSSSLFTGRGERRYIGPLRLNGTPFILKLSEDNNWQTIALHVVRQLALFADMDDLTSRELEFCGWIFVLWSRIYDNHYANLPETVAYQKLYKKMLSALNYMHEHYGEKLTSSTLARQVHLNVATFCRYFKQLMGESPLNYLNSYRISQSRTLLIETNDTVANIASRCGYGSLSYFNRDFKNRMRMTPSEYRKH